MRGRYMDPVAMTNWLVLASGVLALITAAIHVIAGGKDIVRPLMGSSLGDTVKGTLYACWHIVSVTLVLSSLALLASAVGLLGSPELVAFVSVLWLLFGAVFVVVALSITQPRPRGLLRFPQWLLLLPVGLLGLLGLV